VIPSDNAPSPHQATHGGQDRGPNSYILLPAAIRNLRNNPQLLFVRLPNILSFLCIVIGVVWLLLLPLNDYSRQTYISENALLPGQVHAYFTGSEQNIFRGYKKELQALIQEGRENGPQNPEVESTPAYVRRLGGTTRGE
jgi:glycosylphosphatidylinositol transamidase